MPAQALQHFKMTHVSESRTCIRYFACIDILWYVFCSWVWICTSILHNPEKNKVFVFWECEMIFKSEDKSEDKNTYVNSKLRESLFEERCLADFASCTVGKHGKTHAIRREEEDVVKRNWRLAGDTSIKSKKVGYAIVPSKIATRRWLKLYMLSILSIPLLLFSFTVKRLTGFNERELTSSVGVKFRFTIVLHELARGWIGDFASAAVDGIAAHFQQALGPLGHCMTKLSIFVFALITRWLDSTH